jgi:CDP-diacylglycerol---glycerol-3-phosphate 3-phosphatidyltransferase
LLAASKNVVLAAERYGKHKTISQIVAIIAMLVVAAYPQWGAMGELVFGWTLSGKAWAVWFTDAAKWAAVALTVGSGSLYLWRNRELYLNDL